LLLIVFKEKRPTHDPGPGLSKKFSFKPNKNCASIRLGPGFPKNSSLAQHDRWLIAAYFLKGKKLPGLSKKFFFKTNKMCIDPLGKPGLSKKNSTNKIKIVHRSSFQKKFPKKYPPGAATARSAG